MTTTLGYARVSTAGQDLDAQRDALRARHRVRPAATAAQILAARVSATGAKADIAAASYVESDEQSAQRLAEVASGSVVV